MSEVNGNKLRVRTAFATAGLIAMAGCTRGTSSHKPQHSSIVSAANHINYMTPQQADATAKVLANPYRCGTIRQADPRNIVFHCTLTDAVKELVKNIGHAPLIAVSQPVGLRISDAASDKVSPAKIFKKEDEIFNNNTEEFTVSIHNFDWPTVSDSGSFTSGKTTVYPGTVKDPVEVNFYLPTRASILDGKNVHTADGITRYHLSYVQEGLRRWEWLMDDQSAGVNYPVVSVVGTSIKPEPASLPHY